MAAPHLAPINPPLGVLPAFTARQQMTMKLREKVMSLSGDTFLITDAMDDRHELLKCRGQTFSISDRKEFTDAQGNPIFSLRTKLISFPHKRFYAEAPDGKILFEVKGKFSSKYSSFFPFLPNSFTGFLISSFEDAFLIYMS